MDKVVKKTKEPVDIIKVSQECIKSDLVLPQFKSMCEEITCAICLDIVWNPVSCGKCTSPIGKLCLYNWFKSKDGKCPSGCNEFVKSEFSLILTRLINKIEFSCMYKSNGCQEIVHYENFYKHINSCTFANYKCSYPNCTFQGERKTVLEHTNTCPNFIGHCSKCRFILKRADYLAHKENKNNVCFDKCLVTIEKLISQNEALKKENSEILTMMSELKKEKVDNDLNISSLKDNNDKFVAISKLLKDKNCSHDLKLDDYTNSELDINCDICLKEDIKISLGCRQCNIDFCLSCFKPKLTDPIMCPKAHVLKLLSYNMDALEFNCDKCKRVIKTDYCFDCRDCNYDLCFSCYKKALKQTRDCIIF